MSHLSRLWITRASLARRTAILAMLTHRTTRRVHLRPPPEQGRLW